MGLTQLQRAYKRKLTDLYDADDEDEVTPSRKRQKPTPADGDTRVVVEYRCDSPPPNQEALEELPRGPLYQSSSESECVVITRTRPHYHHAEDEDAIVSSPPANQEAELPWGPVELLSDSDSETVIDDGWTIRTPPHYYDDVDEDAIASSPAYEKEDDDAFEFSPASPPPLTQSTQEYMTPTTAPTTLYVFPMKTIVLKPDESIADQHTITHPKPSTSTIEDPKPSTLASSSSSIITHPKPSTSTVEDPKPSTSASSSIITHPTIEDPKPSTSTTEEEEDPRKVCFLAMQTHIAYLIAHQWWKSAPSTVEEVTVDVCRSLAVTVLSAPYQEILMKYVRCAIRQPRWTVVCDEQ